MKGYSWMPEKDSENMIAVVADNVKEAKKIGWSYWGSEFGNDNDYIDAQCHLIKDAQVEGLPKGIVDDYLDGLKRNLYGYCEECDCPRCQRDGMRVYKLDDGEIVCSYCEGNVRCPNCEAWSLPEDEPITECEGCEGKSIEVDLK